MNGTTRKKFYQKIAKRDGEYCRCCGALAWERQLVVDHRDNNPKNNSLENFQILCRKCNYLKNPRRPLDLCESEYESGDTPSEISINRTKEPQFKVYLAQRVWESKDRLVPEHDLVYSAAEILSMSPITIKRYLDTRCSSEGGYRKKKVGNTVCITVKDEFSMV